MHLLAKLISQKVLQLFDLKQRTFARQYNLTSFYAGNNWQVCFAERLSRWGRNAELCNLKVYGVAKGYTSDTEDIDL